MKTFKKMLTIISILLVVTLMFAACGAGNSPVTGNDVPQITDETLPDVTEPTTTDPVVEKTPAEMAIEALTGVALAEDAQAAAAWLSEDSQEMAEQLASHYPGTEYTVTVDPAGQFEDCLLFYYTIEGVDGDPQSESGVTMFRETDDGYRLCLNSEVTGRLINELQCGSCGGSGQIQIAGSGTCGLCGGTGQTYNPAVYYDSFMQMWQGMWQACGGCGGSGQSGFTTSTCGTCMGYGIDLH